MGLVGPWTALKPFIVGYNDVLEAKRHFFAYDLPRLLPSTPWRCLRTGVVFLCLLPQVKQELNVPQFVLNHRQAFPNLLPVG